MRNSAGWLLSGSPSELRALLNDGRNAGYLCAHVGLSMNPTLCALDLLEMVPCAADSVRAGDVILFEIEPPPRLVVHRVVRVTSSGIRTRGDNSLMNDPWVLQPAGIVGRVGAAWRGETRRTIAGGRRGLFAARRLRLARTLDRHLSRLLHAPYHTLASTGLARRWLPENLRPRVVTFQSDKQRELRLLQGRRLIGHYDPREDRWHVRRPFRLFVDQRTLPVGNRARTLTLPPGENARQADTAAAACPSPSRP